MGGHTLEEFLAEVGEQARVVLDAAAGWPTYHAGIAFMSLAAGTLGEADLEAELEDLAVRLHLLWGELTDAMDAPGRHDPQLDAAAVDRMKRAAAEWVQASAVDAARSAYLDRWMFAECGYRQAGE